MLASDSPVSPPDDWQRILAESITSPGELLARLDVAARDVALPMANRLDFPMRVPGPFADRMQRGDPRDPLLLQVLPQALEDQPTAGFTLDPLQELAAAPDPGVIHKYRGRVLLVTTGACAINCRYCFRRHFPYPDHHASGAALDGALEYIRGEDSLSEVILSGGDPLILNDRQLSRIVEALDSIPHVKRLRVHSRIPVVLPQRMTPALLEMLDATALDLILVIHANHAHELDSSVKRALAPFRERNVTLLNQSVLLRGVNDSVAALVQLSQAIFDAGVLPYYLHLLDPVQGAAHFQVSEVRARELYGGLLDELPGYLVPRLAQEKAGATAKSLLARF